MGHAFLRRRGVYQARGIGRLHKANASACENGGIKLRQLICGIAIAGAVTCVASERAVAAEVADCANVLVQDYVSRSLSIDQKIALLNLVNRENFEQVRRSASNDSTIIIYGIPMNGVSTYEQFDERREKFLSEYRFTEDTSIDDNWIASYLPSVAPEIYSRCIDGLDVLGAHIWAVDAAPNKDVVAIKFTYVTAVEDRTRRRFTITAEGGTLRKPPETVALERGFRGRMSGLVYLDRESIDEDALVSITVSNSANGGAETLTIPARPKIEQLRYERGAVTLKKRLRAKGGNGSQHRVGHCWTSADLADRVQANNVRFIQRQSIVVNVSKRRAFGGDEYDIRATAPSPHQLCLKAKLGIARDRESHWADFDVSAQYERPTWTPVSTDRD